MKKWLLMMLCGVGVAMADDHSRATQLMKRYDQHVAGLRAEFRKLPADSKDKSWVKAKLRHMVEVDQFMRTFPESVQRHTFTATEGDAFDAEYHRRFRAVDRSNTAELKKLLLIHRWFTISEFGVEADHHAWLLVQHADEDPDFQRHVLALLEPLASQGETKTANYAYLFDRVAVGSSTGKRGLQRYGTQGRCIGPGAWRAWPVEQPEKLDERRGKVGLMPQAEYEKFFKDVCRKSDEEAISKAIEAAKPRS